MKLRKRFVAWVLAGVMAVSSVQLPASCVYAEEAGTESDKMIFETDTAKNELESNIEDTFKNNVSESELWSEVNEEDAENTEKEHQTSVADDQEEFLEEGCKETTVVEQTMENEELSEELGGSDSVEVQEAAEDSNNIVLSGNCGEHVTFVLDSDGVLTISGSGDMSNYSYNQSAPWGRSLVKTISIEIGVTSIGNHAFRGCSWLTSLAIPKGVTSIGDYAFDNCNGLTSVTIPEGMTSIGDYAFYGCSGLTSVTIPKSVTSIGDSVFDNCSGLTSVIIPEGVTNIGDCAFGGCSGLTSVTIPEGVTNIGDYAFSGCSGLISVTIPEGVISIGNYAFSGCSGLTSVTIPEGVTSIENSVFNNCSSLTSITIPEGVTSIGNHAFWCCSSLISVTIPEGVTSIGDYAFEYCRGLTSAGPIGGGYDYEFGWKEKIPSNAFSFCSGLTSVTIPEGVMSIGSNAFSSCSGLTSMIIPKSVMSIGSNAFSSCSGLTDVFYGGNEEDWSKISIDSGNFVLTKATIHYNSTMPDIPSVGNISTFMLSRTATGVANDTINISGEITLSDNIEASSDILQKEIDDIQWTSSNSSIAQATECSYKIAPDNRSAELSVTITSYKEGTATITGTTSNGLSEKCKVTIINGEILENISSFSVIKEISGTINDKSITFTGKVYLKNGTLLSNEEWDNIVNSINWTSSKANVADSITCKRIKDINATSYSTFIISVTPEGQGETVITGTMLNGLTAKCTVIITEQDESSSELTTITKTKTLKDDSYGVKIYKSSKEGKIYDLSIEFNKALDEYLNAIKDSAGSDLESTNNGTLSLAQQLRQADKSTNDKVITMSAPNAVLDSVYEAYAMYLSECTDTGIELGKIDLSKNTIEIGVDIVNKIRNKMGAIHESRRVGQYTVRIDGLSAMGAVTGTITVSGKGKTYYGSINTSTKKTAQIMTQYIDDLCDIVKDLLKNALKSVFTELSQVTGISEFTDKAIRNLFKDFVDVLRQHGYGDILTNVIKLKDSYELIEKIVSAKDAKNLMDALDNATSIYDKLKSMDYSDDAVSKAAIDTAMKKLNKVKGNLEDALYEYIYGIDGEEESFWSSFKKIFIQCPVDFTVYDADGSTLGYVDNGTVFYNDKILIEQSGDVKTVYIPENLDVNLKLVATGDGEMNYVIEEVKDEQIVGRMNYYNIPLVKNEGYTQSIDNSPLGVDTKAFPMKSDDGEFIYANECLDSSDKDAHITVNCSVDDGGVVIGDGDYPKGNPVEISAFAADETLEFCGWYINDDLVSLDNTYRFTALQDVNIRAGFQKRLVECFGYDTKLGDEYEEFAWVSIYENEKDSNDIAIRLIGADLEQSYEEVTIKGYSSDGVCLDGKSVKTESNNTHFFWLRNIRLKEYVKMEIYDSSDKLIAVLTDAGTGENTYTVHFDMQGHGIAPDSYTNVKAGNIINEPLKPTAEDYIFTGWYKEADCKTLWDFATDIVTSDITLYAGWIENNNVPDNPDNPSIGDVLPEDIPADGKIPDGLWIAGVKDCIYTGKAIKPEVRVYDSNRILKAGQDYTISYKNNIKANDASKESTTPAVVIKGKGNYTGTEKQTFKILPLDLNDTSVTTEDITVAYNKKMQKKVPVVTYNGRKLANNKDFTVSYPDKGTDAYKAAGIYNILLTAKQGGNFTGTRIVRFTITNNTLISGATVKKIANQTYTGKAIEPELEVTMKKEPLVKNLEYTVTYVNNIESGTATAILTGIGKYAGTKKVTFKINGTPLKGAIVSGITDKVYNGTAQEQKIKVTLNNKPLTEKTDYEVVYFQNTNVGKATVTIKGIKAYSGMVKKTFKITAYDMKENAGSQIEGLGKEITAKYLKGGSKPKLELTFAGKKLIEGTDYTVSCQNNKTVTTADTKSKPTMTIKGKGNFKGSLTKTFIITGKALNDTESPVTLTVADKGFVDKAGKYISVPVLTDADGKNLAAGKDYERAVVYTLEDGTELTKNSKVNIGTKVKVRVTGKGAYTGELVGVYQITQNDFNKAKISISPQTYTGKAVTLNKDSVTVKIGKETLAFGTDYEIMENSYANNIKKGTASVTIVGKGNYGGTKTVKFKITARKLSWFWRLFG